MDNAFRPRFECLEGRDVPASFSMQFDDGTVGLGEIVAPASVDASQAYQSISLTNELTMTAGG